MSFYQFLQYFFFSSSKGAVLIYILYFPPLRSTFVLHFLLLCPNFNNVISWYSPNFHHVSSFSLLFSLLLNENYLSPTSNPQKKMLTKLDFEISLRFLILLLFHLPFRYASSCSQPLFLFSFANILKIFCWGFCKFLTQRKVKGQQNKSLRK